MHGHLTLVHLITKMNLKLWRRFRHFTTSKTQKTVDFHPFLLLLPIMMIELSLIIPSSTWLNYKRLWRHQRIHCSVELMLMPVMELENQWQWLLMNKLIYIHLLPLKLAQLGKNKSFFETKIKSTSYMYFEVINKSIFFIQNIVLVYWRTI